MNGNFYLAVTTEPRHMNGNFYLAVTSYFKRNKPDLISTAVSNLTELQEFN